MQYKPINTSFASHYGCSFRVSARIAGNSQLSGPKRGITIETPALFLTGFEKVHNPFFANEGNHNGLIVVIPNETSVPTTLCK